MKKQSSARKRKKIIAPVSRNKLKSTSLSRTSRRRANHQLTYLFLIPFILITLVLTTLIIQQKQEIRQHAQTAAFKFVVWGDTKGGTNTLSALSTQAAALSPAFTLYSGDLEETGFTTAGADIWKGAMGTLFSKSFIVRGNHDINNPAGWQSYFNFSQTATTVGATNFNSQTNNLTYSFDSNGSHFIAVDVPGDSSIITADQVNWIDTDLTAAEGRNVTNSFILFHGPVYYVDDHASTPPENLITVLNKHQSVTATLHGHEHVQAYVHIDSKRIPSVIHPFEEIVAGEGGAESYTCSNGRSDWCDVNPGFALIEVNGQTININFYKQGSTTAIKTVTLTKAVTSLTPSFVCGGSQLCVPSTTLSPVASATAIPVSTVAATLTSTPSATITSTPIIGNASSVITNPQTTPAPNNNNQGLLGLLLQMILMIIAFIMGIFNGGHHF